VNISIGGLCIGARQTAVHMLGSVAIGPKLWRTIDMRKIQAILMVAVFTAAAMLTNAAPASAAIGDMGCTANPAAIATVTYSPGVTLTPQTITYTINGSLSPCVSLSTGITSGTFTSTGTASLSCIAPGSNFNGDIYFTWSNGKKSTVLINSVVDVRLGVAIVLTMTGPVTHGLFKNDTAIIVVTLATSTFDPLLCIGGGVTSATGIVGGTFA
jgi:hypothetical protein